MLFIETFSHWKKNTEKGRQREERREREEEREGEEERGRGRERGDEILQEERRQVESCN